jgi:hypothetical protein
MNSKLKQLLKLWFEAHTINYISCNCIGDVDLSQEHFKIVNKLGCEKESWIAIHKSMIHGDWEAEFDNYEEACDALSNHLKEQIEEVVFLFIHDHSHCEEKGFEFVAAKLAAIYRIFTELKKMQ